MNWFFFSLFVHASFTLFFEILINFDSTTDDVSVHHHHHRRFDSYSLFTEWNEITFWRLRPNPSNLEKSHYLNVFYSEILNYFDILIPLRQLFLQLLLDTRRDFDASFGSNLYVHGHYNRELDTLKLFRSEQVARLIIFLFLGNQINCWMLNCVWKLLRRGRAFGRESVKVKNDVWKYIFWIERKKESKVECNIIFMFMLI